MALLKQDAQGLIRELMDDAAIKLWSAALLDRLTTTTLDGLWGELLQMASRLTSQLDTISVFQSPGFIRLPLTSDTPAGDLTQRFFRVQSVTRGNTEYVAADPRHIIVQGNILVNNDLPDKYVYYRQGKQLWLFPLDTSATRPLELRYSYLPAKFSSLNATDNVEWPEGFEDAYVFKVAGRAMMKGGRESGKDLLDVGEQAMMELRSHVQRPHGGVVTPYQHMDSIAWGGE